MIRPAKAEDAEGILAIFNPIIENTTITFTTDFATVQNVVDGLATHADRGDPYLVAERDGCIAGFAKYGPFRSGPGYAGVVELTVHLAPEARGHNIGRDLLAALMSHAKFAGKNVMISGVSGENDHALGFFTHMGFEKVAHLPGVGEKFGRRLDLIFLQKNV